jgi:hypothetical protein
MSLRNDLVHPKHQDRTDDNGYVSPQPAVVRDLQSGRQSVLAISTCSARCMASASRCGSAVTG